MDLELAETYTTETEFSDLLLNCIENKERKADRYRESTNVNELWLLIVIDDINSFSGFRIETGNIPTIHSSNFDRILIFEKFGCAINTLFSKTV